jgi:hypothetical protein
MMRRVPRQVKMRLCGKVQVAWAVQETAAEHEMMASENNTMYHIPSDVGN